MKIDELENELTGNSEQDAKKNTQKLAELVEVAQKALESAQTFADQHSLSFRWDDEYGCRKQTYVGKGVVISENNFYDEKEISDGQWISSSTNC